MNEIASIEPRSIGYMICHNGPGTLINVECIVIMAIGASVLGMALSRPRNTISREPWQCRSGPEYRVRTPGNTT